VNHRISRSRTERRRGRASPGLSLSACESFLAPSFSKLSIL
jgi:hypothetical protein